MSKYVFLIGERDIKEFDDSWSSGCFLIFSGGTASYANEDLVRTFEWEILLVQAQDFSEIIDLCSDPKVEAVFYHQGRNGRTLEEFPWHLYGDNVDAFVQGLAGKLRFVSSNNSMPEMYISSLYGTRGVLDAAATFAGDELDNSWLNTSNCQEIKGGVLGGNVRDSEGRRTRLRTCLENEEVESRLKVIRETYDYLYGQSLALGSEGDETLRDKVLGCLDQWPVGVEEELLKSLLQGNSEVLSDHLVEVFDRCVNLFSSSEGWKSLWTLEDKIEAERREVDSGLLDPYRVFLSQANMESSGSWSEVLKDACSRRFSEWSPEEREQLESCFLNTFSFIWHSLRRRVPHKIEELRREGGRKQASVDLLRLEIFERLFQYSLDHGVFGEWIEEKRAAFEDLKEYIGALSKALQEDEASYGKALSKLTELDRQWDAFYETAENRRKGVALGEEGIRSAGKEGAKEKNCTMPAPKSVIPAYVVADDECSEIAKRLRAFKGVLFGKDVADKHKEVREAYESFVKAVEGKSPKSEQGAGFRWNSCFYGPLGKGFACFLGGRMPVYVTNSFQLIVPLVKCLDSCVLLLDEHWDDRCYASERRIGQQVSLVDELRSIVSLKSRTVIVSKTTRKQAEQARMQSQGRALRMIGDFWHIDGRFDVQSIPVNADGSANSSVGEGIEVQRLSVAFLSLAESLFCQLSEVATSIEDVMGALAELEDVDLFHCFSIEEYRNKFFRHLVNCYALWLGGERSLRESCKNDGTKSCLKASERCSIDWVTPLQHVSARRDRWKSTSEFVKCVLGLGKGDGDIDQGMLAIPAVVSYSYVHEYEYPLLVEYPFSGFDSGKMSQKWSKLYSSFAVSCESEVSSRNCSPRELYSVFEKVKGVDDTEWRAALGRISTDKDGQACVTACEALVNSWNTQGASTEVERRLCWEDVRNACKVTAPEEGAMLCSVEIGGKIDVDRAKLPRKVYTLLNWKNFLHPRTFARKVIEDAPNVSISCGVSKGALADQQAKVYARVCEALKYDINCSEAWKYLISFEVDRVAENSGIIDWASFIDFAQKEIFRIPTPEGQYLEVTLLNQIALSLFILEWRVLQFARWMQSSLSDHKFKVGDKIELARGYGDAVKYAKKGTVYSVASCYDLSEMVIAGLTDFSKGDEQLLDLGRETRKQTIFQGKPPAVAETIAIGAVERYRCIKKIWTKRRWFELLDFGVKLSKSDHLGLLGSVNRKLTLSYQLKQMKELKHLAEIGEDLEKAFVLHGEKTDRNGLKSSKYVPGWVTRGWVPPADVNWLKSNDLWPLTEE